MRLVFKLPKNKLPFIGVTFESEYVARTLNRHLVNEHKNANYEIRLEPTMDDKLLLTLICHTIGFTYSYEPAYFNRNDFSLFLHHTHPKSSVNFSHVIYKGGKECVPYTLDGGQLFVLGIASFRLIVPENLYVSKNNPL
jgi:hypothetical protein